MSTAQTPQTPNPPSTTPDTSERNPGATSIQVDHGPEPIDVGRTPEPPSGRAQPQTSRERDRDGLTEMERHKIRRGMMKDPRKAAPNPADQDEIHAGEDGAELPSTEARQGDPAAAQVDKRERFVDDDTGEEVDLRTRQGKRIKRLLFERAQLRAEIAENAKATRQPTDPAARPNPAIGPQSRAADATTTTSEDPEPTLDAFATWDDYNAARTRWLVRNEVRQATSAERAAASHQREQAQTVEQATKFASGFAKAREIYPDFDEALSRIPMHQATAHIQRAVLASEHGTDLAYYIGSRPDVLRTLMTQPTLDAHLRMLGRIEAQVEALVTARAGGKTTTPAAQSAAPAPITAVSTTGGVSGVTKTDPGAMSPQEWRAHRKMGRSINAGR
jgi:hypothetical protein